MPVIYGDLLISIWGVSDVMRYGRENFAEVSLDEAKQVLEYIRYNYNADNGINWRRISDAIDFVTDERKGL